MYFVNKIVYALLNPVAMSLIAMFAAVMTLVFFDCSRGKKARRFAISFAVFGFSWLLAFSLPAFSLVLGFGLENEFPPVLVETAPEADAIVVLGGGMASNTNKLVYAEMMEGADRVWQAARLYRAGKAPLVIASGIAERDSTLPLLLDFGIPEAATLVENDSRNTEENAKFVERELKERFGAERRLRIILVTSAWHMRRSLLMFSRYAPSLDVVPSAADYPTLTSLVHQNDATLWIPSSSALDLNNALFKEHIGYWGYKLFR